ncbi:type-1 angiotensin II receptor-associated protein [Tiliqua scincoides]|uniref:type-1 angiotensin II receptor-associated protein n=1 Tax=Tiliqua scincoides TaxID=71010 RepID=UPI0034622008
MEVPAVNLKAVVLVHWLLTTWGCMADWLPSSYAWGNFTTFALGVWAVAQRDSVDAILMFLIGLVLTILTDVIHFCLFYPSTKALIDLLRFSTGMAIFSLILKPVSCYLSYWMYRERGGEYSFNLGTFRVGQDHSSYQSIDNPDQPPHLYPDVASKSAPPRPY